MSVPEGSLLRIGPAFAEVARILGYDIAVRRVRTGQNSAAGALEQRRAVSEDVRNDAGAALAVHDLQRVYHGDEIAALAGDEALHGRRVVFKQLGEADLAPERAVGGVFADEPGTADEGHAAV